MYPIYALCRPGFEVEAGQELVDIGIEQGCFGHFQPFKAQGLVSYILSSAAEQRRILESVPLASLVFTRDWLAGLCDVTLPKGDRVQAVHAALADLGWLPDLGHIEIQVVEANQDRDLHRFARKWTAPLSRRLREVGLLGSAGPDSDRMEIVLLDFERALIGYSLASNRSPFVAGRPRLRFPPEAPSRSTLKLEEAWHVFVGKSIWYEWLGGGKKAVDLGAAPGGWTWQLVNQGMMVTAVDNGPMDARLMASGHVEHIRADGFTWAPRRAVDWLVCDIVDKPRRTSALMARWLANRWCRFAIFNLKLPMKQRYAEWLACRDLFLAETADAGVEVRLQAKQLYHDREEVTCFVERLS